ncbi:helix-turn-helix domain-containing protein [Wielerella bovis]|uniref:helix-turn-helix domain-containing protein n=1 Tax=Wielerella bovis TaxID=2917790 RepID=UPI002018DEDE|nr:helix-turn-helix transcriptional regulator [Wielerella bovis]ULJ64845.1 helix-turn-helix domain-containing protein [Wielerella bovis]
METYEKIRLARELNQWSQEEMAEKLEMSPSGYARIERGEVRLNIERLEQIAQILNVDISDLIQKDINSITIQIKDSDNNQNIGNVNVFHENLSEIEKLKLIIQHRDELLEQKTQELNMIKEMFELLKQQIKNQS